ncbi:MAG: phosphatidate cytidylyltransferase [Parachlamydiaceae bacterium]
MITNLTPLQQRLTVGGIGTLISLVIIFLSPIPAFKPFFTTIIAATICVAMWELYQIYRAKGLEPAVKVGLTFGALYAFATAIATQYVSAVMLPELILLISLLSCFFYYFSRGSSPLFNLSATMFGIIYLAVPLGCIIRVAYFFSQNQLQDGRWWLFYLIAVTKMTDTGGFFIGKQFGKEKLAPHISPKKTWEGALGGLCAAIFASIAIKWIATAFFDANAFGMTWWQSIWLGIGIGIFAQCGDLSESLLKRDGGVKDSNQLPGLGGILDLVDSLVFSSPLVYIFLKVYY